MYYNLTLIHPAPTNKSIVYLINPFLSERIIITCSTYQVFNRLLKFRWKIGRIRTRVRFLLLLASPPLCHPRLLFCDILYMLRPFCPHRCQQQPSFRCVLFFYILYLHQVEKLKYPWNVSVICIISCHSLVFPCSSLRLLICSLPSLFFIYYFWFAFLYPQRLAWIHLDNVFLLFLHNSLQNISNYSSFDGLPSWIFLFFSDILSNFIISGLVGLFSCLL